MKCFNCGRVSPDNTANCLFCGQPLFQQPARQQYSHPPVQQSMPPPSFPQNSYPPQVFYPPQPPPQYQDTAAELAELERLEKELFGRKRGAGSVIFVLLLLIIAGTFMVISVWNFVDFIIVLNSVSGYIDMSELIRPILAQASTLLLAIFLIFSVIILFARTRKKRK